MLNKKKRLDPPDDIEKVFMKTFLGNNSLIKAEYHPINDVKSK